MERNGMRGRRGKTGVEHAIVIFVALAMTFIIDVRQQNAAMPQPHKHLLHQDGINYLQMRNLFMASAVMYDFARTHTVRDRARMQTGRRNMISE